MTPAIRKQQIQGKVTAILDGNSFQLEPGETSARDLQLLGQIVTVTIADRRHLDTHILSGMIAKLELEKRLAGEHVRCEIVHRYISKGLIATIELNKSEWGFSKND